MVLAWEIRRVRCGVGDKHCELLSGRWALWAMEWEIRRVCCEVGDKHCEL